MVMQPRWRWTAHAATWPRRWGRSQRRSSLPAAARRRTTWQFWASPARTPDKKHIVTTAIEHPAILEPARALERDGWLVTYVPVDETGQVSVEAIADAITAETALVSVMAANNEVGTLQPIRAIGELCEARGVLFHSDLAQVVAYSAVDVERDHIHLASCRPQNLRAEGHWRALHPRPQTEGPGRPDPFGGGQERGLRPGR